MAYVFPVSLSFSHNATMGALLADIPIFSIGLLGSASLTFFLFLKKLNLAHVFLFSSVIISFIAAILDLTQILIRQSDFLRHVSDATSVSQLQITREIFFSIATGLRFLFFWVFVAQRPRGEPKPRQRSSTWRSSFLVLSPESNSSHSGSWMRWGIAGAVLQWAMLGAAIAILLLQILWRTLSPFHHFGSVYAVEGTLEIVSSGIFIVKIVLNALIAETPSRRQTVIQYSGLVVALFLNAGLGAGNIVYFAFTESSLGRLLLAVEIYVIIVLLLVWTFSPEGETTRPRTIFRDTKRASSFQGLRTSFGDPLTADAIIEQGRPAMQSSARRLSSWFVRRTSSLSQSALNLPSPVRDERRSWSQGDLEQAVSPTNTEKGGANIFYDPSAILAEAKQSARWRDPVYTSVLDSPLDTASLGGRGQLPTTNLNAGLTEERTAVVPPSRARTRPGTAVSIPSYYGDGAASPATVRPTVPLPYVTRETESPIYGLNGTLRAGYYSPVDTARRTSFLIPPSARSSGFSNLLREQNELEKSIAALRMFAPASSPNSPEQGSDRVPSANLTAVQSRGSVSVRSEFSLSIFPEPPWARRSDMTSTLSHSGESAAIVREPSEFEFVPPRMPAAVEQTLPTSTRNSEDTIMLTHKGRSDSEGTRYDVTSFIGDLMTPGHRQGSSTDSSPLGKPTDVDSETSSATVATATFVSLQRKYSHTLRLDGGGGRIPPTSPSNVSTEPSIPQPEISNTSDDVSSRNPVDTAVRSLAPSPNRFLTPSPPMRGLGIRSVSRTGGRIIGLPSGPKMGISAPSRQSTEEFITAATYERPRPAPLVTSPAGQ
ncbi:hypothetical protein BV25DRAFT_1987194 [Artomyces pyxidatus]|uniref:Uncharacterized protein n=1 Tax=Artomyces pyxidatus TaxID=48021 RepID=A0ACB8TJ11_9AGAM|nr:hypothetical protein BV25DRAFT_1987194 [Artomyces pyxidatus]